METLYKYTSFFGMRELIDNHLRLSIPSTLNDPFERLFDIKLENEIIELLELEDIEIKLPKFITNEVRKSVFKKNVHRIHDRYGIISFSETPRNLLMWAHYANQHAGLCIGYKTDFLKKYDSYQKTTFLIEEPIPQRVKYDCIRSHELRNTPCNKYEIMAEIKNHFLTKGDVWTYEKEHRSIIPVMWADRVKFLGDPKKDCESKIFLEQLENEGIIKKVNESEKFTYELKKEMHIHRYMENKRDIAYFIKAPLSAIASIYLGCNLPDNDKKSIEKTIKNNQSEFGHIKLYESKLSQDRFELEFNPLL